MSRFVRIMSLLLVIAFVRIDAVTANPMYDRFFIDQSATGMPLNWWQNIAQIPQIGQEFTPSLTGINFVEIFMQDAECQTFPPPHGNESPQVQIRVRAGTISGPVLGSSVVVPLAPCFDDIARFQFPSVVPLEPGRMYVLEIVYAGGREPMVGAAPDNYSGGAVISLGQRVPNSDLWFREGIFAFIVKSKNECKNGGWKQMMRPDTTLFKNQGECVQYVNTGK